MDKKNTMLLTVIAVATLLVAVVGATFAYFSVTGTNTSTTNTVTTEIQTVGTVTLKQGHENFYMNLTALQMDKSKAGTTYYAQLTDVASTPSSEGVVSEEILEISVEGSDDRVTTNYTCTFDYAITTTNVPEDLVAADGKIDLTIGEGITGINPSYTILATKGAGVTGKATVQLTDDDTTNIVAAMTMTNTGDNGDTVVTQNYLKGIDMTTTIAVTNFNCNVTGSTDVVTQP